MSVWLQLDDFRLLSISSACGVHHPRLRRGFYNHATGKDLDSRFVAVSRGAASLHGRDYTDAINQGLKACPRGVSSLAMPRGGARPGAGRPRGAAANCRVPTGFDDAGIVTGMLDKLRGVWISSKSSGPSTVSRDSKAKLTSRCCDIRHISTKDSLVSLLHWSPPPGMLPFRANARGSSPPINLRITPQSGMISENDRITCLGRAAPKCHDPSRHRSDETPSPFHSSCQ